ncbi:hypothetical protein DID78_06170 [Candidatus Marinamargulisbacteria bacterium SCGC AG-343-D04]|nr:hypothetical protein DID78_06170 [Candidatus Marinamargulisbacteria bacterium SCGC AG-343-D04]
MLRQQAIRHQRPSQRKKGNPTNKISIKDILNLSTPPGKILDNTTISTVYPTSFKGHKRTIKKSLSTFGAVLLTIAILDTIKNKNPIIRDLTDLMFENPREADDYYSKLKITSKEGLKQKTDDLCFVLANLESTRIALTQQQNNTQHHLTPLQLAAIFNITNERCLHVLINNEKEVCSRAFSWLTNETPIKRSPVAWAILFGNNNMLKIMSKNKINIKSAEGGFNKNGQPQTIQHLALNSKNVNTIWIVFPEIKIKLLCLLMATLPLVFLYSMNLNSLNEKS